MEREVSENVLHPYRRGEELSAKVKVFLSLVPKWTL